jgi:hypothetical protein
MVAESSRFGMSITASTPDPGQRLLGQRSLTGQKRTLLRPRAW